VNSLIRLLLTIVSLGAVFSTQAGGDEVSGAPLNLSLVEVATGFDEPVELAYAGQGDPRLFVVEKDGVIKIMDTDGNVNVTPFLDIEVRVDSSSNEEGLLGLAFHPDYANNGRFYVQYTFTSGQRVTRISEFLVSGNPDIADDTSENVLLTIDQHSSNHNAGGLHFSPNDGFLYVPMGDGGGGGDTGNHAQTRTELLGKIVRIDVDEGAGAAPDCVGNGSGDYTVPNSNPFIDGAGNDCDEMWAIGLRNPFRSGFDRETGDFFIGDVGQGPNPPAQEEINFQPASSIGGENYGWRCYEGFNEFNTSGCGPIGDYTFPIFVVDRAIITEDCSIIGGRVYRGSRFPLMIGRYFSGDYCSGNFYVLTSDGMGGWESEMHADLTSFGTAAIADGANGEIYVVNESNGRVYHLQEETEASILSFESGFENGE
jgi:glucose/arabinose dehydrogenase